MPANRGQQSKGISGAQRGGGTLLYPLPPDTARAWRGLDARAALNAGLVFHRYVADWSESSSAKGVAWKELVRRVNRPNRDLLAACLGRWRAVVLSARGQEFALRTDWRLVTGLGGKGPLEAGFAFSRHGFPILPGSGLKGLARAWGLRQVAEAAGAKHLGKVDRALSSADDFEKAWAKELVGVAIPAVAHDFRHIFGTTAAAGGAVFFDGMPSAVPELKLDIMNPHYPDYYRGDGPPSDDQNPVPVYFLTVAPGAEFVFAVGWRGRYAGEAEGLRAKAEKWLRHGLTELGAGAKTSAGYGYFVEGDRGQP